MSRTLTRCCVTVIALATLAPCAATADSGLYVGASAGGATLEADLSSASLPGLPNDIDEDDTAFKVYAGYNLDLPLIELAVEGGFVDFGEPEINVLGEVLLVDTTGFNVWGIAALDVGLVDVFAKLGYIAWDIDARLLDESVSEDGSDIGYGLGLRFELGPLGIRGEYEIYDVDDADITMLSVGLVYHFD